MIFGLILASLVHVLPLAERLKLAQNQWLPVDALSTSVAELPHRRAEEPHRNLLLGAMLLDEVDDRRSVIGCHAVEATGRDRSHGFQNFGVRRIQLKDVAAAQDRFESVVPFRNHVGSEKTAGCELEARPQSCDTWCGRPRADARTPPPIPKSDADR